MDENRAESTAAGRAQRLERLLGPLDDPANPVNRDALLTADEHWEILGEAEARLEEFGFAAELVPTEYGGRFTTLDGLGRILRPVFRRDPALGFARGLINFIAASMVWIEGDETQRKRIAALQLDGRLLTVVRREEAHANDLTREEILINEAPDGPMLNGLKSAIANSDRARGLVVMAREADAAGTAAYTTLLLDREELADYALEELPRYPTVGMRGCYFGGLEFLECPIPPDAVVGERGRAVQIGLRGSVLVRGLVAATQIASGDTLLRTAAGFVAENGDGPSRGVASSHETAVLSSALLELQVADCLALTACRAVHVIPQDSGACAAAAAYLVPKLLAENADNLTVVLGNAQFSTTGRYGLFQKQLRDLPVTGLGHAGTAGRQAALVANLPRFAARSWFHAGEPDPALFRIDGALPPLDLDRIRVVGGEDPLAATLLGCARRSAAAARDGEAEAEQLAVLRTLTDAFVAELEDLRRGCLALGGESSTALLNPHGYALADRYALVCAAAAALAVWRAQREGAGDAFLADPRWAIGALTLIGKRLDLPGASTAVDYESWALAEVFARLRDRQSFDLYRTATA